MLYVLHLLYLFYGFEKLNKLKWIQINTLSGKNKDKKRKKETTGLFLPWFTG